MNDLNFGLTMLVIGQKIWKKESPICMDGGKPK